MLGYRFRIKIRWYGIIHISFSAKPTRFFLPSPRLLVSPLLSSPSVRRVSARPAALVPPAGPSDLPATKPFSPNPSAGSLPLRPAAPCRPLSRAAVCRFTASCSLQPKPDNQKWLLVSLIWPHFIFLSLFLQIIVKLIEFVVVDVLVLKIVVNNVEFSSNRCKFKFS